MPLLGERKEPTKSILDRAVDYVCTPCYQPSENEAVIFQALGFSRSIIESFWNVFCRINTSLSGEISHREFFSYFKFDSGSSQYINRCFEYFDTKGGGTINFLEFVVSIWNICNLKIDTLANFSFDMYDFDSDGVLSLPEIERMVQEVYGKNLCPSGVQVLSDINSFAAERGGVLNLSSFTLYTLNHSLLLFPIFSIQRTIQEGVMGFNYWRNIEIMRPVVRNCRTSTGSSITSDYRHVHKLLRTCKSGNILDVTRLTGDINLAVLESFKSGEALKIETKKIITKKKLNYESLKNAVDKIKSMNIEQRGKLKQLQIKGKQDIENAIDAVTDLGIRTKKTFVRLVSLVNSRIHGNNTVTSDCGNTSFIKTVILPKVIKFTQEEEASPISQSEVNKVIGIQRHKDKKKKTLKNNGAVKGRSKQDFSIGTRSRTPGVIAYFE